MQIQGTQSVAWQGNSTRAARRLVLILLLILPQAASPHGGVAPTSRAQRLVDAAIAQTHTEVRYDSSYRKIAYPGGDVPESVGVCADVVIRAYRRLGIDLQVKVHEDMQRHFSAYPHLWGLPATDTNIDHRRVPNLQTFFRRAGSELPVSQDPEDYHAGDLVTWSVPPHLPHIGIVTDRKTETGTPLIVHNIGQGPQIEDVLFTFPITGHYRYGMQ